MRNKHPHNNQHERLIISMNLCTNIMKIIQMYMCAFILNYIFQLPKFYILVVQPVSSASCKIYQKSENLN